LDDPSTAKPILDSLLGSRALTRVLIELASDTTKDRIAIQDVIDALGEQAAPALTLLLALPNIVPVPPGTSAILGAPLLFLTAQLALGLRPWLPKVIAQRSMRREDFAALVRRITPWLAKAEGLLKPRLQLLVAPGFRHLVGIVCLLLASVLFLPIPLGNMLPALAICLLALGLLERDGLWILAGLITAASAVALVWGVVFGLIRAAFGFLVGWLG
jgi:hypothetical protein